LCKLKKSEQKKESERARESEHARACKWKRARKSEKERKRETYSKRVLCLYLHAIGERESERESARAREDVRGKRKLAAMTHSCVP